MALLLLALVGVLLGCSPSDKATVGAATGSTGAAASSTVSTSGATPPAVSALEDAYTNVVQSVTPSVVEIASTTGLGSGVVYDDEGNIVTTRQLQGATDLKWRSHCCEHRRLFSSETNVHRTVDCNGCMHRLARLFHVARHEDGHIRKYTHDSDVLRHLMRGAVWSNGHAGVCTSDL